MVFSDLEIGLICFRQNVIPQFVYWTQYLYAGLQIFRGVDYKDTHIFHTGESLMKCHVKALKIMKHYFKSETTKSIKVHGRIKHISDLSNLSSK